MLIKAERVETAYALSAWFESTSRARCLVDRKGRVLTINAAARRFLSTGVGFFLKNDVVDGATPEARARWREALALQGPSIVFAPTASPTRKAKRFALLEPVKGDDIIGVVFWAGARPDLSLLLPLARHYGFSAQHTRVAFELAHGRTVEQIARKLGVKVDTVRTHLKAIYEKAGIHSQPGVMAALLRFSKLPV